MKSYYPYPNPNNPSLHKQISNLSTAANKPCQDYKGWVSGKVNVMSEIKNKRTHFIGQKALDERKKLLRFIKGEQRAINECEKWISFSECRIRSIKSHPRYQSEDGTISIRQKRSLKKAEENIQYWTSSADMHKKFIAYYMSLLS